MAIRFENKADASEPEAKRAKPVAKPAPDDTSSSMSPEESPSLPFAKPVKADKKRRGR